MNDGGKLLCIDLDFFNVGWWNDLYFDDVDGDGDFDVILGNLGMNSCFEVSVEYFLCLYVSDYDGNGFLESVFIFNVENGKDYFYVL